MKYAILVLFAILLLSCESNKSFNITTLNGFPSEIKGCSCYYAETEADFAAQRFLYIDAFESNPAFISVDGKQVQVDVENPGNSGYTVINEIEEEVQLDQELWHREGTITITDSTGASVTKPFYGECGC